MFKKLKITILTPTTFTIKLKWHVSNSKIIFVHDRNNSVFKTRDDARGITRCVSQSNREIEKEGEYDIVRVRVGQLIVIEEGTIDCGGCCALLSKSIHSVHPGAGGGRKHAMSCFFFVSVFI